MTAQRRLPELTYQFSFCSVSTRTQPDHIIQRSEESNRRDKEPDLMGCRFRGLIGDLLAAQVGSQNELSIRGQGFTAQMGQLAEIGTGGQVGAYKCIGPQRLPKLLLGFKGMR